MLSASLCGRVPLSGSYSERFAKRRLSVWEGAPLGDIADQAYIEVTSLYGRVLPCCGRNASHEGVQLVDEKPVHRLPQSIFHYFHFLCLTLSALCFISKTQANSGHNTVVSEHVDDEHERKHEGQC